MGSTKVVQTPPPPAPTTGQAIEEYIKGLPEMYRAQLEWAPKFAEQEQALLQQLYPFTSGLQEQIAGRAAVGMEEGIPPSVAEQYRSQMASILGPNIQAPIGAEYLSRQMVGMGEDWKRYYQNLGLTAAGRQPLAQAPQMQAGYGFPAVSQHMVGGYGPYAQAWGQGLTTQQDPFMQLMGGVGGAFAGGLGAGMGMGWWG